MEFLTVDQLVRIGVGSAQALLALATFILGYRVYKHTQKTEELDHIDKITGSINQLNALALSSEVNLKTVDALYRDGRKSDIESARRRWATFLALQGHQQIYLARDVLGEKRVRRHQEQVLDLLLRDPRVIDLLESRGFDSEFVDECKSRFANLEDRGKVHDLPNGAV
jgi:hypothetical protein